MNRDPYFIATVANKFIKSAVKMGKLPKELNLECIIEDHGSYVDCNYHFTKNIYDKNKVLIDKDYIKKYFQDKFIMENIN